MITATQPKTLCHDLPLSYTLALQAREEQMQNGTVSMRCPKCHEHPVVRAFENRVYVRCKCGYVALGEISF